MCNKSAYVFSPKHFIECFCSFQESSKMHSLSLLRYEKDIQLFKSKVVDSVKLCSSHLFDPPKIEDPHAIR